MKKFSLLIVSCFLTTLLSAAPIGQQIAQKVGIKYLTSVRQMMVSEADCQLVYSASSERDNTPCFYVFNVKNGFVMVSGDDCAKPILGYSTENRFVAENMPNNIKGYLQDYVQQIELAKEQNIEADIETQREWQTLLSDEAVNQAVFERNTRAVTPLLTTTWDQSPYYNTLCPGTGNNQAVTGCVATAMAQIINFWEYPTTGFGSHSYTSENYGPLSTDFSNTTFQYSLMPDALTSSSSSQQINAVATLMYCCGVGVNMHYGSYESGALDIAARVAFISHFNYQASTSLAERDAYSSLTEWQNLLKNDLNAGHPIYYSGSGDSGGHAFVCDGYDNANNFHFNWGWSGSCNGYFALDALNPDGSFSFNSYQSAILNIVPASSGQVYLHNINGVTTQHISSSAYIAHPYGFNNCNTYNYTNEASNQLILYPSNSGNQLLIELLEYQGQIVSIYDGVGTGGTLLQTVNSSSMTPKTSTAGALTLVYSGNFFINGFKFLVSTVGNASCDPPSNVANSVNGYNVNLTWTEPAKDDGDNSKDDGTWISHSTGEFNTSYGFNSGYTSYAYAMRFTQSQLAPYIGKEITKMTSAIVAEFNCKYCVWTGTVDNLTLIYEQNVATNPSSGFTEITFNTPVPITGTTELWVGYKTNNVPPATYFLGVDSGPYVANANYIIDEYGVCYEFANTMGIENNFIIAAYVEGGTTPPPTQYYYNIYRNGQQIASNVSGTSYTDSNLTDGQYCYVLRTICTDGESPASNTTCATVDTGGSGCDAPVLSATSGTGTEPSIVLQWSAVSGATLYTVYFQGSAVGQTPNPYVEITGVEANVEYCFTVTATCSSGESAHSNQACATYGGGGGGGGCDAPVLSATSGTGTEPSIVLQWSAVSGATLYTVYFQGSAVGQTPNPYVEITGLEANVEYCFTVTATCSSGESAHSNQACATYGGGGGGGCDAPVLSAASGTGTEPSIVLQWSAVSGATLYTVYFQGSAVGQTPNPYVEITGLEANVEYCFTVTATCSSGESAHSNQACATYGGGGGGGCDAPVLSAASGTGTEPSIVLQWTAVSGATQYNIYSQGTLLGNIQNNYVEITGVEANVEYCFTVTATCSSGESAHSNQACATYGGGGGGGGAVPVLSITGSSLTESCINLQWTPVLGASSYTVYSGNIPITTVNTTSTCIQALPNVNYCFTVTATVFNNESAHSNEVCSGVGLEELEDKINLKIYPNPANTFVNIECDDIQKVEIYNIMGQLLDVVNTTQNVKINTNNYKSGIYFFRIYTTDGVTIPKRVMISH